MTAPRLATTAIYKAIDSPRRGPHKVGTRLVVLWLAHSNRRKLNHGFEHRLHTAVEQEEVLVGVEIDLHNVRHNIRRTTRRLILAHRVGQRRVKKRDFGQHRLCHTTELVARRKVANHASRIHLRACCRERKDSYDGQRPFDRLRIGTEELPSIVFDTGSRRHKLGGVNGRATAHSQKHVYTLLLANIDTRSYRLDTRVRLNARKLKEVETCTTYLLDNLIVEANTLNRATAVGQQDTLSVAFKLCAKV